MMKLFQICTLAAVCIFGMTACSTPHTTNTARSAVEEALTCEVVEAALQKADITAYAGMTVYMDYSYLSPQVNKDLMMGYMEQLCAVQKMTVVKDQAKADVVFQLFSGVLATDIDKFLLGTPPLPVPVPDTDLSIVIPEIALFSKYTRSAYARFFMTVKDAKTDKPLQTISCMNSHAKYVDWVVLLIPFKTHTTALENETRDSKYMAIWED